MNQSSEPLFKYKNFRLYLITRFLMTFAIQMQNVITGWYLYVLTKDPFILGIVGLAEAIPALSTALFAGNLVDKYNKRTLLMLSFCVYTLCGFGYTFFGSEQALDLLGTRHVVIGFYAVSIILGLARAFAAPTSFSILSYLFPKSMMTRVTPISSTAWQIGAIAGPTAGGFIYAASNAPISSLIVSAFMILSVFCASMLPNMPPYSSKDQSKENMFLRIWEGLQYVFKNKVILSALSLDLFAVLFGGAVALLPVFADEVLHVGAKELGWLRAAPSVGSALLLLALSASPPKTNTGMKLLVSVAGFGICIIGFALSKSLLLSLVFLFGSGAFDAVSVVIRGTILQLFTPDHMRGRVSAVNTMFIGSSNEIGAFESGTAARLMGLVPSVIFGGIMTLLVVGTVGFSSRKLRKLQLNEETNLNE